MDRRRAAGLLALAACIACSAAAPTASNQTALDLYDKDATEGCYYNFQHYGEGDRIMTNEPCLNCTCHNRMLMCYLRVCPFTKPIGQDCTVEKRADQCCPIVTCPDVPVDLLTSTSTSSPSEYGSTGVGRLDRYGCVINGRFLPEGSKVPPAPNKPCEHCYCIRNMTTCVMQECTLHVDGCTPIYHKDVCCPVRYSCDHPEDEIPLLDDMTTTVRPTPGFLLTTTTVPSVTQIPQDCVHDDEIFPDGSLIKTEKACEHCYCMKGDIVCVVQECGTPMENEGKNCTSLPPREGQCCPDTYICEGDNELSTDDLTTYIPPRRPDLEGSGYRIESDITTETPLESEGSGEELIPEKYPSTLGDMSTPESMVKDEYPSYTTPGDSGSDITSEPDKGENTVPIDFSDEKTVIMPIETTEKSMHELEKVTETTKTEEVNVTPELSDKPVTESVTDNLKLEDEIKSTSQPTESDKDTYQTTEISDIYKPDEEKLTSQPTSMTSDEKSVTESSPKATKRIDDLDTSKPDEKPESTVSPQELAEESEAEKPSDMTPSFEAEPTTMRSTEEIQSQQPVSKPSDTEPETTEIIQESETEKSTEIHFVTESITQTATQPTEEIVTLQTSEENNTEENITVKPSDEQMATDSISTQEIQTTKLSEEELVTEPSAKITQPTDESETLKPNEESNVTEATPKPSDSTQQEETTKHSTQEAVTEITFGPEHSTQYYRLPTTVSEPFVTEAASTSAQMTKESETHTIISEQTTPFPSFDKEIIDSENPMTTSDDQNITEPPSKSTQPTVEDETSTLTDETTKDTTEQHVTDSIPNVSYPIEESETSQPSDITTKKSSEATTTSTSPIFQESDTTDEPEPVKSFTEGTQSTDDIVTQTPSNVEANTEINLTTVLSEDIATSVPSDQQAVTDGITEISQPSEDDKTQTPTAESVTEISQTTTTSNIEQSPEQIITTETHYSETTQATQDEEDSTHAQESLTTVSTPELTQTTKETQKLKQSTDEVTDVPNIKEITVTMSSSTISELTSDGTTISLQDVKESESTESSKDQTMTQVPFETSQPSAEISSSTYSDKQTSAGLQFTETMEPIVQSETTTEISFQPKDKYDTPDSIPTTEEPSQDSETLKPITEMQVTESTSESIKPTGQTESPQLIYDATTSSTSEISKPIPTGCSGAECGSDDQLLPDQISVTHCESEDCKSTSTCTSGECLQQPDCGLNGCESETLKPDTNKNSEPLPYTPDCKDNQCDQTYNKEECVSGSCTGDICTDEGCKGGKPITETSKEDHALVTTEPSSRKEDTGTTFTENIAIEDTSDMPKITTLHSKIPVTDKTYTELPQTSDDETTISVPKFSDITTHQAEDDKVESTTQFDLDTTTNAQAPGVIPGEGNCLVDGKTFSNDTKVPSTNKCQANCKCVSSIVKCDPIICSLPPDNMVNCQAVYDTIETCCPTYVCDPTKETVPPQSHSQMSGTESPISETVESCSGPDCKQSEQKLSSSDKDCQGSECEQKITESCASGDCITEKIDTPQCTGSGCKEIVAIPVDITQSPQLPQVPQVCLDGKCTSSPECTGEHCQPANQICNNENGCTSDSSSSSCHGADCDQSSIQPQSTCENGQSCDTVIPVNIPIQICEGESCQGGQPGLEDKPTDQDDCNSKTDCSPQVECSDETCIKKDVADLDNKFGLPCSDDSCIGEPEVTTSKEITTESVIDATEVKVTEVPESQETHPAEIVTEETEIPETHKTPMDDISTETTKVPEAHETYPVEFVSKSTERPELHETHPVELVTDSTEIPEPHDARPEETVTESTEKPESLETHPVEFVSESTEIPESHETHPAQAVTEQTEKPESHKTPPENISTDTTKIPESHETYPIELSSESTESPESHKTHPMEVVIDSTEIPEPHDTHPEETVTESTEKPESLETHPVEIVTESKDIAQFTTEQYGTISPSKDESTDAPSISTTSSDIASSTNTEKLEENISSTIAVVTPFEKDSGISEKPLSDTSASSQVTEQTISELPNMTETDETTQQTLSLTEKFSTNMPEIEKDADSTKTTKEQPFTDTTPFDLSGTATPPIIYTETQEKVESYTPKSSTSVYNDVITEITQEELYTTSLLGENESTSKPQDTTTSESDVTVSEKEMTTSVPEIPVVIAETTSFAPEIQTTQFDVSIKPEQETTEPHIPETEEATTYQTDIKDYTKPSVESVETSEITFGDTIFTEKSPIVTDIDEETTEHRIMLTDKSTESDNLEPISVTTPQVSLDVDQTTIEVTHEPSESKSTEKVRITESTEPTLPSATEATKPETEITTGASDVTTKILMDLTTEQFMETAVTSVQTEPTTLKTPILEEVEESDEKQTKPAGPENITEPSKEVTPDILLQTETTPYLIELEEHTHKEEISTTEVPQIVTESTQVETVNQKVDKVPETSSSYPAFEDKQTTTPSVETESIIEITSSQAPEQATTITEGLDKIEKTPMPETETVTQQPTEADDNLRLSTILPETEISQTMTSQSVTEQSLETTETKYNPNDTETLLTTTKKIAYEETTTPAEFDKYTKPIPTTEKAAETQRPALVETSTTDEASTPEEESFPPSETSGYGQEPDYMEEDQAFGPGTCRYGGKVYVSAQQIPRDDPCDFCFCFRSDIICLQQSCPPPIHGCHEEPIQGFCCPRYECPVSMATTMNVTTTTTTTTTTLPPHFLPHAYKGAAQRKGCQIKGHAYKVGEVVRASSGPCLHCTCGGDGQMKCDPKVCTPEPMLRQMMAAAVSSKRRR